MKAHTKWYRSYFVTKILSLSPSIYVFSTTLLVYTFLWFFNPGNKIIAAILVGLVPLYYFRLKNFRTSILIAFLVSTIVFTGKRYIFQLIPPGIHPPEIFPYGYQLFFIITARFILSFGMFMVILRDRILKTQSLPLTRPSVRLFLLWLTAFLLSTIINSAQSFIPLLFSLYSLANAVTFIYVLLYVRLPKFIPLFIAVLCAQIIFQSAVAFQQFSLSAPAYKNIEMQVDIAYFGKVADELQFRFRPTGTFGHANELAMFLGFALSALIPLSLRKVKTLHRLTLVMGFSALILTLSRGAWIGTLFSVLLITYVITKVKRLPLALNLDKYFVPLALLGLVLSFFFIIPRLEKSLYTFNEGGAVLREQQVKETLALIAEYPLTGVGTGRSVLVAFWRNPTGVFSEVALPLHNWYLLTVAEVGIPTLALFLALYLSVIIPQVSAMIRSQYNHQFDFVRLGLLGGFLVLTVVGIFQPFIGEDLLFLSFAILTKHELEQPKIYEKT